MGRQGPARHVSTRRLAHAAAAAAAVALPLSVAADAQVSGARRLFGSFSAEAGNPTMSSSMVVPGMMMPGMYGQGAQQGTLPMMSAAQEAEATEEASEFIGAMMKSFLNKEHFQPGELDCITEGSKSIGGNFGRVASQVGLILEQAFQVHIPIVPDGDMSNGEGGSTAQISDGASSIEDMVNQIASGRSDGAATVGVQGHAGGAPAVAAPAQKPKPDPSLDFFYNNGRRLQMLPGYEPTAPSGGGPTMAGGAMGALPVAMELGYNMQQMVSETKELVGKCLHEDAKETFKLAGEHMRNLNYITGHFLANGADIVKELADSVLAYEARNATRFGSDVGIALRKVFLSKNAEGKLPEGLPGDKELANVTAGMLTGFFGPGTRMNIKFSEKPDDNLQIDMQHCVSKNIRFFQEIWASTMYLYAQRAVGVDAASKENADGGKVQFATMVGFMMMQLPSALEKCNIDTEHKDMIIDSIKAMGQGMHVKFSLPHEDTSKDVMMSAFAQTVEDWSQHKWYEFGSGLGASLRKAAVAHFPQKYSIGVDGNLIRILAPEPARLGALMLVLPGMLLLSAVLATSRRALSAAWRRSEGASDIEEGAASDSFLAVE